MYTLAIAAGLYANRTCMLATTHWIPVWGLRALGQTLPSIPLHSGQRLLNNNLRQGMQNDGQASTQKHRALQRHNVYHYNNFSIILLDILIFFCMLPHDDPLAITPSPLLSQHIYIYI